MKQTIKQILSILLSLWILCLTSACSNTLHPSVPSSAAPSSVPAENTIPETQGETAIFTTVPATEPTTEPVTEPATVPVTKPEHSDLYIPGVSVEDVILYFNEVCLDSEIINSGNPSYVQKWAVPIHYILYGEYTDEDLSTLSSFVSWLNTIEGFPGISEVQDAADANLRIHFCTQPEMINLMGENFSGMDGAVTFWYFYNKIDNAIICYRTDLDQYLRNSVILEEIYNGLGPIQDTTLRPDSIIYQMYSEPQQLSAIDELILKLLYHPDIHPGMNAQQCERVIRDLYY